MPREKLNIIIPLYNPHPGWEIQFSEHLSQLSKELGETGFTAVLVNDGSTSGLSSLDDILKRFTNLRYLSYEINRGKGYAIRYGINHCEADYYIYTDIDFPFGCSIIPQVYQQLTTTGNNIVIGTREASYFRMLPVKRRIYSFLLKELNFIVTGFRIRDTQAGLKGLDNNAKKVLAETRTDTFLFELEFLKQAIKQGLKYEFINVTCRQNIRFTDFRFGILLKETLSLFKLLLN